MKLSSSLLVVLGLVALASCEVFFEEKFLDGKAISCVFAGDYVDTWRMYLLCHQFRCGPRSTMQSGHI